MSLDTIKIIGLSVLLFCLIVQLLFYWTILAKPYYHMQNIASGKLQLPEMQPSVSIILCIKNPRYDLFRFLPDILEQDYPEFEVIVVTDGVSDEQEESLIRLKKRYSNLYTTHVPEDTRNVSRKKLALTLGIKASRYDTLLFTEADSHILTKKWISLMVRHFSNNKNVVLGFSALENSENRNGLFPKFMAYDYFFSNLQMISLALLNHPYAGNGRNMAYAKKYFVEQKGFVKHRILQQGEDDLFINEIATKENTAVELSEQSLTLMEINDFRDWKHQKIDRMCTKQFYKRGPVALWRLESSIRIGFWMALVTCFICGFPYLSLGDFLLPGVALLCFIIRLFSQSFVINKTAGHLQLEKFYLTISLFDLFQPFMNFYFFICHLLKGKENYTYRYEKR